MAEKYSLAVENHSRDYGNICVFQTMPDGTDNLSNVIWYKRIVNPAVKLKFEWNLEYGFSLFEPGRPQNGDTYMVSQEMGANNITKEGMPGIHMRQTVPYGRSISSAGMPGNSILSETAMPDYNAGSKSRPRYWVAYGDFKEGDRFDASILENAVELKTEDKGKKIVINEDNSISIE